MSAASLTQLSAVSLAELRAVEKQQLRLLLEQQQRAQPSASPSSSFSSYATPYPIMNLSDDWYQSSSSGSTSPLPPLLASQPDELSFLDDEVSHKLSSFTPSFPSSPPFPTLSPPPYLSSSISSSSIPNSTTTHISTKRAAPTPDTLDPLIKRHQPDVKKLSSYSSLSAHYPLLSSEVVDGFFAGAVGMSGGVMGGLDDAELGLALASPKVKQQPPDEDVPSPTTLPTPQRLTSVTSALSTGSLPSLSLPPVSVSLLPPLALSSVLSHFTSASSEDDNQSLSTRFDEPDTRGEGVRRAKRRLTDKQRRAKIKDGLEQLRSLVASHGNVSSDQASIVQSSVELVQQLVLEREGLRGALRRVREERMEMEREQQVMLAQKQRLAVAAAAAPQSQQGSAAGDGKATPNLSLLLQHLQSLVAAGGASEDTDSPAPGLDHVVLSQYFLQTLQLLSKLPRQAQL